MLDLTPEFPAEIIIGEGRNMVMVYPHMCICRVCYNHHGAAFSILGDGVRDVLDPKLR